MPVVKPRVLVSACLLGEALRYDGAHKRDPSLDALRDRLELIPFCPEVSFGLPVPREPMRLEAGQPLPKLLTVDSREDRSLAFRAFARDAVDSLVSEGLQGCITQSRSPSCGLGSTLLHPPPGQLQGRQTLATGDGLFIEALRRMQPRLPIIEAQQLEDTARRQKFLERVFEGELPDSPTPRPQSGQ